MSDEEYIELLTEEDPYGEATESDWEDFWLVTEYIEDEEEEDN